MHEYNLDWIDEQSLFDTVKKSLKNPLGLTGRSKVNPPDPFTLLIHSVLLDVDLTEALAFEELRVKNKKISNSVGAIHQSILGLAPNWRSCGASGGVLDLETIPGYSHPRFGKPIVAEVKNRFNTVKASDENKLWDTIDQVARSRDAQGYLFQITPQSIDPYDDLWEPSGRPPRKTVRVCDGVTAYEIVFGKKTALQELYLAFPLILHDIMQSVGKAVTTPPPSTDALEALFTSVYPS